MPTSTSPKAWKTFDYSALDASTCQFVQQQTGEIRGLMKRTVESVFEIGQRLIVVKERLGHGRFGSWLETEFEWSQDTANNLINVAKKFGNFPNFSEFDIAASALYMLAAPSTPDAARDEAIARAKAGESVTLKTARSIKQKYTVPALKKELAPKQEGQTADAQLPSTALVGPSLPRLKQEIIAIRPPQSQVEVPLMSNQSSASLATETLLLPQKTFSTFTDNVPGVWWQLGSKHLIFNGDPNSLQFLAKIPASLSLLLAFPFNSDWQPLMQANTKFIRTDESQGRDSRLFEDTIESIILLCSSVGGMVVSCFIPSIDILAIVNRLDRRALIAEPDTKRVNATITEWKQAGLKVEKVN